MAQILYTVTRENTSNAWFTVNPNTIHLFSNTEIEVLTQSRYLYANLDGFISSEEILVDDTTLQRKITFDTLEHANAAYAQFSTTDANSIFFQRTDIIRRKMEELGQPVTYEVVITP